MPADIADFLNQLDGYEDIDIYFIWYVMYSQDWHHNQLKRYIPDSRAGYADGMAASIASVIMFACDELHFATGDRR